jgi:predicted alpha/beta-hydrolase family hydrolase
VADLAADGYRCVAVDQRGHGDSPTAGADRLDSFVADATAVCAGLGGPVVIVGASLGGFAALGAAAARPAAVAGIVLVDVVPEPDPERVRAVIPRVTIGGRDRPVDRLVTDILGRGAELRGALAGLDRPVLLAHGTGRSAVTPAALARFPALARHGRSVAVAGAGHLVARERPAALAGALRAFLASRPVRARHDPDRFEATPAQAAADALLAGRGAHRVAHMGSDLLTHLEGTEARLRGAGAPEHLALAGLTHAAYGTDGFRPALLGLDERDVLRAAVGGRAEATVYRYAACDRRALADRLGRRPLVLRDRFTGQESPLNDAEAADFARLSAADERDLIEREVWDGAGVRDVEAFLRGLAPYAAATRTGA